VANEAKSPLGPTRPLAPSTAAVGDTRHPIDPPPGAGREREIVILRPYLRRPGSHSQRARTAPCPPVQEAAHGRSRWVLTRRCRSFRSGLAAAHLPSDSDTPERKPTAVALSLAPQRNEVNPRPMAAPTFLEISGYAPLGLPAHPLRTRTIPNVITRQPWPTCMKAQLLS